VPRWEDANVDANKILDYLLSIEHPVGADKARFFTSMGYHRDHWERLRDDLLRIAHDRPSVSEQRTNFGFKYVVDGMIRTPAGRIVELRTIWISDDPDGPPRLVTAYPR